MSHRFHKIHKSHSGFVDPLVFLLLNRISTYIHTVSNMCGSQLMYRTLILNLFHQENGADKS